MKHDHGYLVAEPVALIGAWPGDVIYEDGDDYVIVRRLRRSLWRPVIEETHGALWPLQNDTPRRHGGWCPRRKS